MTIQKNRHGCLTAWLVFIVITSAVGAVILLSSQSILGEVDSQEALASTPSWVLPISIALLLLNIVFTLALFSWKKWGFWGLLANYTASFVIDMSTGTDIGSALLGLLGLAILYGVLQLGEPKSGWAQLE